MSRGPGRIQRILIEAFSTQPERQFTTEELAEIAYPGIEITEVERDTVRRALGRLERDGVLPLHRCRIGSCGRRGWQYVIARRAS